MPTINADGHPLMQRFHKPDDEKRMLVILTPNQYDEWLTCPMEDAECFFVRYPAERLLARQVPKPSRKTQQASLPDVCHDVAMQSRQNMISDSALSHLCDEEVCIVEKKDGNRYEVLWSRLDWCFYDIRIQPPVACPFDGIQEWWPA